jgi:hypothetical protein
MSFDARGTAKETRAAATLLFRALKQANWQSRSGFFSGLADQSFLTGGILKVQIHDRSVSTAKTLIALILNDDVTVPDTESYSSSLSKAANQMHLRIAAKFPSFVVPGNTAKGRLMIKIHFRNTLKWPAQ